MNIAVFASHNGTDLQAIIDACGSGAIDATVCAVLSNNSNSTALARAEKAGIDFYHVSEKVHGDFVDIRLLEILGSHNTDVVFLAGYLKKLGSPILHKYQNKVFNIHPSLLPKYGGTGMYGINIHQAVINAHDSESGITIHRVNEEYDEGEIVAQKRIPVLYGDTAESLANRILEAEHDFIVEVIRKIISEEIPLGVL